MQSKLSRKVFASDYCPPDLFLSVSGIQISSDGSTCMALGNLDAAVFGENPYKDGKLSAKRKTLCCLHACQTALHVSYDVYAVSLHTMLSPQLNRIWFSC